MKNLYKEFLLFVLYCLSYIYTYIHIYTENKYIEEKKKKAALFANASQKENMHVTYKPRISFCTLTHFSQASGRTAKCRANSWKNIYCKLIIINLYSPIHYFSSHLVFFSFLFPFFLHLKLFIHSYKSIFTIFAFFSFLKQ